MLLAYGADNVERIRRLPGLVFQPNVKIRDGEDGASHFL